jgi:hypothetical protein
MLVQLRQRNIFVVSFALLVVLFAVFSWRTGFISSERKILELLTPPEGKEGGESKPDEPASYPKYKKVSAAHNAPPIVDNFPLAAAAHSAAELPPIPRWNIPRSPHVPEKTPLFIGFTRNWRMLQQVVVSYITAGWPPEDIYVVENTGVLDANKLGQLSLQNPFFLNHTRLDLLGVNVIITPTLLSFAQLQNFYLWMATTEKYPYYFWSHMDLVVLSDEGKFADQHPNLDLEDPKVDLSEYKSVYDEALDALYDVLADKDLKWAMRFFSYDRLALVNVTSFRNIGGWDTQIPFYMTDCDMHARLEMENYNIEEKPAGRIWDIASGLDDLIVLYRKKSAPGGKQIARASFQDPNKLYEELEAISLSEKELEKAGMASRHEKDARDEGKTKGAGRVTKPSNGTHPAPTAAGWGEDQPNSELYKHLVIVLDDMFRSKADSKRGRNTWQSRQMGGQGDPFYRDSEGFEEAVQMTITHGRAVFSEKWGHRDCDIVAMGLKPDDAWKVEHDW